MDSDLTDEEGFYQGRYLPEKLAERAVKVTDDPLQLPLVSFRSPEAQAMCRMACMDLISAREIMSRDLRQRAREGVTRFDP